MVHQKAPCCKAGRFSYVDLYWENRHLVSGLPFLVYTSEYSISGLRMCLQNGGSAVSWKSELKFAKLDGVLQAAEKGKLWQPGKYNEPAPEIVWCAQLPAPFMVEREKRQIKPAREKRVVRWLSRGIAHIERVKKHARVKNRTRAFLWCVILCPLEYTLPLRLFQLFQHLEWWIKTQAVTRTFENRRWLRCFSLRRRKDRSNSWLQKLVLNLHQVNC